MKVAALDLGTNTFLCLIAEGTKAGITKVHKDLVQVVRLGQDISKTGKFHPDALQRARQCLLDFKNEIDKQNVDAVLAMATSAARDASNGYELFDLGKDLNIPIQIIAGEDEARITYQGATAGLTDKLKTSLVIDVGGGSTELIYGKGDSIYFGDSLNIGGVRLTEKFISTQPVPREERKSLQDHIKEQLKAILARLKNESVDQIIAVAGTPTSLVAIEIGGFDEKKVDGFFLKKERLECWVEEFANTTVEEKKIKYNLGGRADIIYAGSEILLAVIKALNLPGMVVSTKGVRYGVALEMLRK
ncbi:MAG: Ppx/GppA phosphatase family protein [Pseudobdellovibrionaceae bacterium]